MGGKRKRARKSSQRQEGTGSDELLANMELETHDSAGPKSKRRGGKGWKAYLEAAGLYDPNQTTSEQSEAPYTFEPQQLKHIGINIKRRGDRIFCHIAIPNFDLRSVVAGSKKAQPPVNPDFEADNEGALELITDRNIIIYDCTGNGDVEKGEILAIKVGAKMKPDPTEDDAAIPDGLLSSLTTGLYRFLATEPKATKDNTGHKSSRSTVQEHEVGVPIPKDSCIDIHAYCTKRNDQSVGKIELSRRPPEMWYGSRDTEGDLMDYLKSIRPLTQLTEKIFQFVVPDVFSKYKLVWEALEEGAPGEKVKGSFGIWTSRKILLCAPTGVHVDLLHVPLGYCALIPLGEFTDGHICLPSLGIKLELQPGSILFLRSHLLPYYVGKWSGYRFCIVQYTRQCVFDYYVQKTGEQVFPVSDMPPWYSI